MQRPVRVGSYWRMLCRAGIGRRKSVGQHEAGDCHKNEHCKQGGHAQGIQRTEERERRGNDGDGNDKAPTGRSRDAKDRRKGVEEAVACDDKVRDADADGGNDDGAVDQDGQSVHGRIREPAERGRATHDLSRHHARNQPGKRDAPRDGEQAGAEDRICHVDGAREDGRAAAHTRRVRHIEEASRIPHKAYWGGEHRPEARKCELAHHRRNAWRKCRVAGLWCGGQVDLQVVALCALGVRGAGLLRTIARREGMPRPSQPSQHYEHMEHHLARSARGGCRLHRERTGRSPSLLPSLPPALHLPPRPFPLLPLLSSAPSSFPPFL
eukprot:scaffold99304_cov32-Tisochrysis_lutea.AAC.1